VAVLRAYKRKEAEGKLFSLLLPFLGFVKKQGSRGQGAGSREQGAGEKK
jgi:hypothetical protein